VTPELDPLDAPSPADVSPELRRVAVLERVLAVSVAGIWENVLDWPHVPWLHPGSFTSIELLASGRDWWRARVGLTPASLGREVVLELTVERGALRYVTRTLEGPGSPAVIVSTLAPLAEERTAIRIEFFARAADPLQRRIAGQVYTRVYRRLWDEDEAMIVERAATLPLLRPAATQRVALGPRASLELPRTVEIGGLKVRVFAVGDALRALALVCPHMGGPLPEAPTHNCRTCPWHGYRYDASSGARLDARGPGLESLHVEVDPRTGEVVLERRCAG
jgi:nitrite reductase/ring-hydroxylating ferredoxin subunit